MAQREFFEGGSTEEERKTAATEASLAIEDLRSLLALKVHTYLFLTQQLVFFTAFRVDAMDEDPKKWSVQLRDPARYNDPPDQGDQLVKDAQTCCQQMTFLAMLQRAKEVKIGKSVSAEEIVTESICLGIINCAARENALRASLRSRRLPRFFGL